MMFQAWVDRGGIVHYVTVEPFPLSHPRIVPHILWNPFYKKEGLLFWIYFILAAPFYSFVVGYRFKIDLISVFGGFYAFLAIPMKAILRKPIITFMRSDVYETNRILDRSLLLSFFENALVKMGLRCSDRVVAVSRDLKEIAFSRYGVDPRRIDVLDNHIEDLSGTRLPKALCREKLGLNPQKFLIVTVARFDANKNLEMLLKVGSFSKEDPFFLIVGDGPERPRLEKQADQSGLGKKMTFVGWQENVIPFLSSADLFILPSRMEGRSNALLEALAVGLPVLASDNAGNREILDPLLLFDPDDPKGLAEKVDSLIRDPAFFERVRFFSSQARARLMFNWDEKIVQLHNSLFIK